MKKGEAIKAIRNPEADMVFTLDGVQHKYVDLSVDVKALVGELDMVQKQLVQFRENVLRLEGVVGYMTERIRKTLANETKGEDKRVSAE